MPTELPTKPSVADKRRAFRQMHESGCFILPNPWDVGSALYLQSLGFKALASTSSGLAWSLGRPDNALPRECVLGHLRDLVAATDVPINADFENGFGADAAAVADSVSLAVATGVAGLSIEDSTGRVEAPLFEPGVAMLRLRAARDAIDRSGGDTLLVARSEGFLVGRPDLGETISRLQAYAVAGADCLYVPGLRTEDQIRSVVQAVSPKPVNVLVGAPTAMTLDALTALGVRRVSVGGALARAAWGGFMQAARSLAELKSFDGLAGAPRHEDLDRLFSAAPMDDDLKSLSQRQLIEEVKKLRQAIREHRDSSGHDLCWHHPHLWSLLPEPIPPLIAVPEWPQFMRGCIKYRQSLDEQATDAPRHSDEFRS